MKKQVSEKIKLKKEDLEANFDIDYPRALLWALIGKFGIKKGLKKWFKDLK